MTKVRHVVGFFIRIINESGIWVSTASLRGFWSTKGGVQQFRSDYVIILLSFFFLYLRLHILNRHGQIYDANNVQLM